MDRTELSEKILATVKDNLGVKEVKEHNFLIDDLGADDMDIVQLVMTLEEEFGVEILDEYSDKWATVKDIVDFLEKKLDGR